MLPRVGLVGGCRQGCFLYALLCSGGELWGPIAEIAQWTRVRAKVMISESGSRARKGLPMSGSLKDAGPSLVTEKAAL